MSATVVSTTKHKYKWRFQEIFSVIFFVAIPIALYFFTNLALFLSAGTISLAIAVFLIYIGGTRKNKSALTGTVYSDGVVAVGGNGLEATTNRLKLTGVTAVKWDTYAHHPTLLLLNSAGRTLKLPRRLATEEPLNTYIRKNLSKHLYIADEAKETLAEILEEPVVSEGELTEPVIEYSSEPAHKLAYGAGGGSKIVTGVESTDEQTPHDVIGGAMSGGKKVVPSELDSNNKVSGLGAKTIHRTEDLVPNSFGQLIPGEAGSGRGIVTPNSTIKTPEVKTGAGFDEFGRFVESGAVNGISSEPIHSYAGADNVGEKVAKPVGDIGNLGFLMGNQPVVDDSNIVAAPIIINVAPQTIEEAIEAKEFKPQASTQRAQPRKKNRNKR